MEAFINVVYSIYDCVKEENLYFNNVKVQTKMIKYVQKLWQEKCKKMHVLARVKKPNWPFLSFPL